MLSQTQKLKLAPFIVAIKFLGFLDALNGAFEQIFSGVFVATFFVAYGLFLRSPYITNLKYIQDGLVYEVYGTEASIPSPYKVLGVATKRNLPILNKKQALPTTTAKAFLIYDVGNDKVLESLNADAKLAPASTTKLLTILTALDLYKLDDSISMPKDCTEIDGTKLGIKAKEVLTVDELVHAALINSAADAACALAESKVSASEFVKLMNAKAQLLGMDSSNFTNAVGLDGINGAHYSSAKDLLTLTREFIKNKYLATITKTSEYTIKNYHLVNTNRLLTEIPGTIGVKTGTTAEAGEVLIYRYKKDNTDLIIIVMGSQDRFADVKNLLNWALTSFTWEEH